MEVNRDQQLKVNYPFNGDRHINLFKCILLNCLKSEKLKLDPWRKIFPSELGQKDPSGMYLLVFYLCSFIIIIIHGVYI